MDLNLINCYMEDTTIKKVGYRNLKEFIKLIKEKNKSLKKLGIKVTFTITLPIDNN